MNKKTIILTGISGFIGSHLAEALSNDYHVIGLVRRNSDLWRVHEIKNDSIEIVDLSDNERIDQLSSLNPFCIVHSAWGGVPASGRDDWEIQGDNIVQTIAMLQLALKSGVKHFISFGSQAEYGLFDGRVDENYDCKPQSAYGAAKFATSSIVEAFCEQNKITWNWFRLFSIYGKREGANWLIPSVITKALRNENMDLTPCEQRYDYLSGQDLGRAILKVLSKEPKSGVFNLSSNQSIPLKQIVQAIVEKTNTKGEFNIGTLPYRPNQVMHIEGNSDSFFNTFNFKPQDSLDSRLDELIEYYKRKV